MQNWVKLGKLFMPDRAVPWMYTHASNPVADVLANGQVRIYFGSRDSRGRSHLGYLDIEMDHPPRVTHVAPRPLLELGPIGAFDHAGQSMGCICTVGASKYLYYLGWNLGKDVPFRNAIGLAVQDPETHTFRKISPGPIIDRNVFDPFSLSYPFVMYDEEIYKMWYGSHKQWGKSTNDIVHCIKYATSEDGVHWTPTGRICIDTDAVDYAFSKPCLLKEAGTYKMWYSYRGSEYRIGYAESTNGLDWIRKDSEVGLSVSAGGWDSDMVCYAHVFSCEGRKYMLYNGNDYGKTGIGIAVWA